jgi:hypothetical protein
MARHGPARFHATLRTTPDLLSVYRGRDLDGLLRFTLKLLRAAFDRRKRDDIDEPDASEPDPLPFLSDLRVVSAPSLNWRAAFVPPRASMPRGATLIPRDIEPDELVIAYELPTHEAARALLDLINQRRDVVLDPDGNSFLGAGLDPGGRVADHWCPGAANLANFGQRSHARRSVHAEALAEHKLLGQQVNVVIIDEGLDRAQIPVKNWGGGLDHIIDTDLVQPAGTASRSSHGMMIARSVLNLAPEARLYDVAVVPPVIDESLPTFVSAVHAAYVSLLHEITYRRKLPHWSGPWVLVNAWGILDTSGDPSGSYTENTEMHGHPLINLVARAVQQHHLDIVFAAGNCGQFCPSGQCGRGDRGPGRSIWGANAHALVLTAGAVRCDDTWLGYSSQGPGPRLLAHEKPDFCAPSQFCEDHDAAVLNSGTSAACAVAAGVVAALRSFWHQSSVPPQALKTALLKSARKPHAPAGWDNRLGFGILDAAAAITELSAVTPRTPAIPPAPR